MATDLNGYVAAANGGGLGVYCECVQFCHFRSGDKDGGHSIGSAIPEKAINSNLMALPTLANN